MFLADAVAGYVTSLTERELDAPLTALLRSRGFTDVHLLHGSYEFGKDFVARRVEDGVEYQYCIQSKAGDINASLWRGVRMQVDLMRTSNVGHPAFDPRLPRRLVVVTNGRLVGSASSEFQDYNSYHLGRDEEVATLWDIDALAPMFQEVLIEGVPVRDRSRTLELLGQLGRGRGSRGGISEYARHWYAPGIDVKDAWGHVLTCAMLSKEAANAAREDLASQLAFHLLRSTWEVDGPDSDERRAVAREIFADVARDFFTQLGDATGDDIVYSTLSSSSGFSPFVTHPVRVSRLCEVLALGGLLSLLSPPVDRPGIPATGLLELPDPHLVANLVEAVIQATPALSHPIADDHGFALLATCLFLHLMGRDVEPVLREAAIWVLDWIEFGDGLADASAGPEEQVRQLLGAPYKPLRRNPRHASYLLTTLLDLARALGCADLYDSLVNDVDAVGAYPSIVVGHPPKPAKLIARLSYFPDGESVAGVPMAAHYGEAMGATPAANAGVFFDVLATWATLRDRHIPAVLEALAAMLVGEQRATSLSPPP
ncbi:hypothetical protein FE634_12445 [Nocardioides dongxiaopingii]|uniref:restriction endonuclease n=1 Tax=Nocardioides sp. S-1144 TaxID=2582905 RepID=UPI00110D5FC3|nr:restriction endonuclease [Nocardioides sp. S-1144]QCW51006.1 hypothetical protein FE634_12445 [Nocardioides sp. S-1144]